jgi:hypothetical protein
VLIKAFEFWNQPDSIPFLKGYSVVAVVSSLVCHISNK